MNPYVVTLLVTGAINGALGVYAWRNREVPGATELSILLVEITLWCWTYGASIWLRSPALTRAASEASVVISAFVPVVWIVFVLRYSGFESVLNRRWIGLLLAEPVTFSVLVETNHLHGLLWLRAPIQRVAGLTIVNPELLPATLIHIGYAFLLVMLGSVLLIILAVTNPTLSRSRAAALVLAALIPGVADILALAGMTPVPGLELTPYALAATGVLLTWAVYWGRLFDRIPVSLVMARDTLVEELTDPVLIVDGDGVVVDHNEAATPLFDGDDVGGVTLADHLPSVAGLLDDAADRRGEQVVIETDGRERYFDVQVTPLVDEDRPAGHLVSLHDTTAKVLRRQRLDVLDRVLRHNVRTETTIIKGYARQVREADADLADAAAEIERAADRIAGYSEGARNVDRLLDGPVDQVVDLAAEARSVVETVDEGVVRFAGPRSAPANCPGAITEVLDELVENAVEHHDGPTPRVELSVQRDGDTVTVEVADDGPGIPSTERAVLADESESQLTHSSGMGLWITQWVVRVAGGSLEIEDNEPRGSVVRLHLPAADATASTAA
ncbi:hypothetical protein BRC81_00560 [Halobacteriales archaeon QS_1_68_20]|nr:MAG: hypothetical protein BRC81_00560 [Halobacteriales archaeon QS_1_68_20]